MWYTTLGAIATYTVLVSIIIYFIGWYFKMPFVKKIQNLPFQYNVVLAITLTLTAASVISYCIVRFCDSPDRRNDFGIHVLYNITGSLLLIPAGLLLVCLALTYRDKYINHSTQD